MAAPSAAGGLLIHDWEFIEATVHAFLVADLWYAHYSAFKHAVHERPPRGVANRALLAADVLFAPGMPDGHVAYWCPAGIKVEWDPQWAEKWTKDNQNERGYA